MSNWKKSKKEAEKPATNKDRVPSPFDGKFLGQANIVTTSGGSQVIEIAVDVSLLYELMETQLADIEKGASYTDKEDNFYVKLKGIPVKEPKPYKTHFLIIDYYVKPA